MTAGAIGMYDENYALLCAPSSLFSSYHIPTQVRYETLFSIIFSILYFA